MNPGKKAAIRCTGSAAVINPGFPDPVTACIIPSEAVSTAALIYSRQKADITFDDVRVPKTRVVSGFGQVPRRAFATLTYGRIGIGATGAGIAWRIFDE